jgi:AcrR family transcriptional regulator
MAEVVRVEEVFGDPIEKGLRKGVSESFDIVKSGSGRRAGRRKFEALEAAARVIAERGTDATRFVDVADECGIPVSSLQYYFGSREDLLVAAFRHASDAELTAVVGEVEARSDPWEQITFISEDALFGYRPGDDLAGRLWIEAWRFGLRDAEMRSDVHREYSVWHRLIAQSTAEGIRSGRFTTTLSPDQMAVVTLALLDGVGLRLAGGDPLVTFAGAVEVVLAALHSLLGVDAS